LPAITDPYFRVVLIEPEIPQNTGNIGRTCVATHSQLHLVGKLGFDLSEKQLRRAGLDYWPHLDWQHHATWDDWWRNVEDPTRVFYCSTKAKNNHFDFRYRQGDWFVFGKETRGLGDEIIRLNDAQAIKIPMFGDTRSLNLATSVAIIAYEGIRQIKRM
jgi:tRNA (cytidine/uridine-2'-O-)-methyltransferase